VTVYYCEIGKTYADDVISVKIGKFSLTRYHTQGRFIRLIDSYFLTGTFDFSVIKRERIISDNPVHKEIYKNYQTYLHSIYDNENTIHFYEYGMYYLLQFVDEINMEDLHGFSASSKQNKLVKEKCYVSASIYHAVTWT
jgi:hypothetical protein